MAGETVITVVGNLTNDPELRFTPNGAAVASFTIASTPRTLDRATNEWKDGDALFLRCSIWRQAAEHVAESLQKGARVIVQGRLKQRSFETREGEKRTVVELDVDEIGPSLKYATAKVVKAGRGGGGGGGGGAADRPVAMAGRPRPGVLPRVAATVPRPVAVRGTAAGPLTTRGRHRPAATPRSPRSRATGTEPLRVEPTGVGSNP